MILSRNIRLRWQKAKFCSSECFESSKMIIWEQFISSRTEEVNFKWAVFSAPSSLSLFRCLEKINHKSKNIFLFTIVQHVLELFTLGLFSTLNFVNIQNNLKWVKTIKSNPVLAKICRLKKAVIHFELSCRIQNEEIFLTSLFYVWQNWGHPGMASKNLVFWEHVEPWKITVFECRIGLKLKKLKGFFRMEDEELVMRKYK